MTTKPRHTTTKKRHGADDRLGNRVAEQKRLEQELRRQLRELDDDQTVDFSAISKRESVIVRWSVRRITGGKLFVFEYKAPSSTWQTTAEHEAKKAIRRAGLIAWAHLETVMPEARP